MRKMLASLIAIMLFCIVAFGQTTVVTGKVTDASGLPLPNASIRIKGTKAGTSSAADGTFKITVKAGSVLQISETGFEPKEVLASDNLTISLTVDAKNLNEVVVTALGIRRNKNTLPYAAQQISGDDVSAGRTGNAAAALSGKVSGVQITQGNGIGSSTNVVIRGVKSLTGNNQALFVVDGVPIDNSNNNTTNQTRGAGGYDYGNAAADINPDDIETINVLKGAASTALYGSRAANGVIMITTKKAKRGIGVTINSGFTVGKIDKTTMPTYQTQYGVGYSDGYQKDGFLYFDVDGDGVKDLVVPTSEDASYGAKFDPSLMVFQWDAFDPTSPYYKKAKPWVAAANNPTTFYETAISNNHSILFDGVSEKGTYKLGFTRNDEKGTLPNSNVVKNIVNFGSTYNILPNLEASASINYSRVTGVGRYGTGYSGLNVNQNFRQWYQTSTDIQDQKAAYFRTNKNITWNWKDPSVASGLVPIYTDNYYWIRYQNGETDSRDRVFGNVALNYKAASWLSFLGRVSVDNYAQKQEEHTAVGSQAVSGYSRVDRTFNEVNYDLIANFDYDFTSKLNFKALAGTNIRKTTINSISSATNGGLVVPNLYALSNSKGTIAAPTETYQPKEVNGIFAGATFTYDNFLTLDGTIRRDASSTLPISNYKYNYYAISGSWLFSHNLPNAAWLSSGKLRLNYATVGNDAPWGSTSDVYTNIAPFGSTLLYALPGTQNNKALLPENTISREIGLEMAFLKNRVGFDITYFSTNTKNQILPVSVSTATGYNSKYVNAGNVQNRGFEVSLFVTPIKTKDFSWNMNINWSNNKSKVLELYNDSKNLQLAAFQGGVSSNASVGQAFGVLQGKTVVQLNGQDLIGANGYYSVTTTTTNIIADINPKWIGGITNNFRYKNFSLGFLIDTRNGGSLFSLDMYYSQGTGILKESAGLNDLGKPVRNSLADGGGVVFAGVTADGKPNTKRVVVDANSPQLPASKYVYDASYVKLREMNISYDFPQSFVSKIKFIKGAQLSLLGRNLWIIHKNLPYSDPEENLSSGNIQGNQSGAYPTTRSLGVNLKLKF